MQIPLMRTVILAGFRGKVNGETSQESGVAKALLTPAVWIDPQLFLWNLSRP
jgi:hypothetical protein